MAKKKDARQMDLPLGGNTDVKDDELQIISEEIEKEPEVYAVAEEEDDSNQGLEPEIGINELRAQLEQERQARFNAEKRANEAVEYARSSKMDVEKTNLQLLETAIESIKQDNAALKAKMRDAHAIGDTDAMFDLQELVSKNTYKLEHIEDGRKRLENQIRQPKVEVNSDPVEALASQLTPRSADWVRRHPQCVTDQRLYQKMIASHNLAVADGIAPDSDEYFEAIESTMKLSPKREARVEKVEDPFSEAAAPTKARTSPPAAPVSRTASSGAPRQNVVRLSKDEREMAQMMGMTDHEYAKNKMALVKEGKLN
jgi:hypothetical protein